MQVAAYCGVLPEERDRTQPLEIDVDLEADLVRAGRTDDLHDTIDYGAVCDTIEALCIAGAPQLLEHLAASIAEALLATSAADAVTVSVRKLRPPVSQLLTTSGVRITRRRAVAQS